MKISSIPLREAQGATTTDRYHSNLRRWSPSWPRQADHRRRIEPTGLTLPTILHGSKARALAVPPRPCRAQLQNQSSTARQRKKPQRRSPKEPQKNPRSSAAGVHHLPCPIVSQDRPLPMHGTNEDFPIM